uniref:Uncharacterized protein n=1 Tax=Grammatophora oceanica TaxID=210454 RepID=A0A7S1V157_9STRA|mmetsp:Transcript_33192/g.49164  ORF Transcript_33192/g.49164 Transcript_33192/m.49164 type:complete len:139 (+) Transcript_33192:53-469(+)
MSSVALRRKKQWLQQSISYEEPDTASAIAKCAVGSVDHSSTSSSINQKACSTSPRNLPSVGRYALVGYCASTEPPHRTSSNNTSLFASKQSCGGIAIPELSMTQSPTSKKPSLSLRQGDIAMKLLAGEVQNYPLLISR